MASLSLPRVLQQRKTLEEQERLTFEKSQTISINKAINSQECPVKEKHVRSAIIGTFQEKGGATFWLVVSKMPLQDNRIVAWKFCHMVHKLLREGHPQFIIHSQKQLAMLDDLGKLWCHLKEGYGRLIYLYTRLLMTKLNFHRRNPRFPGNMCITEEELEAFADNDINNYFQLSVEMFDYLDDILTLQAAVFDFLDPSRCNSMMSAGQCRLAPLIPCIQDSSYLYDYCVKVLFKLHSSLPMDILTGHRDRFMKQFKPLREFYLASSNLQYFKNLIQIPLLPDNPPNFSVEAELKTYVTPVTVILPDIEPEPEPQPDPRLEREPETDSEPEPEPESDSEQEREPESDSESEAEPGSAPGRKKKPSSAKDFIESFLYNFPDLEGVDLLTELGPEQFTQDQMVKLRTNPNMSQFLDPPVQLLNVDRSQDPDKLIDSLQTEIVKVRLVVDKLLKEHEILSSDFNEKIMKLENELAWKDSELIQERQLKDDLLRHTEEAAKHVQTEKRNKLLEEKFLKLRNHYTKLREEHIHLIREKAEVDRQLKILKTKTANLTQLEEEYTKKMSLFTDVKDTMEARVEEAECETRLWRAKYQSLDGEKLALAAKLEHTVVQANGLKKNLEHDILKNKVLMGRIDNLERELRNTREECAMQSDVRCAKVLAACIRGCEQVIEHSLNHVENLALSTYVSSPDFFTQYIKPVLESVTKLQTSYCDYLNAIPMREDSLECLVVNVIHFADITSSYLIQGKLTTHPSNGIEHEEKIVAVCKEIADGAFKVLDDVSQKQQFEEIDLKCMNLTKSMSDLAELIKDTRVEVVSDSVNIPEDMVEGELAAMEKAIEEATTRIEEILNESRKSHSGIKLEVSEKILDSCTNLMSAVRLLIKKSRLLQAEIVAQGKGSDSAKEFYKRNHQWTEGLISAAKAVGVGAKFLLTCADKVVRGQGTCEQLIVASQNIAASTAQLVVASRVKAERTSDNLSELSKASKEVTHATAGVVATAKSCSQLVEESDDLDISELTLHQAKRLEMESQVRVLELEASLQQERQKLAMLRRQHYQLAGEGEGWEKKDMQ